MTPTERREHYNRIAPERDSWRKENLHYHQELERIYSFIIPKGSSVLEIGCGTGHLLNAVQPARGVGIDFSHEMVSLAHEQFPQYDFIVMDAEVSLPEGSFDYIIISGLVGELSDIQKFFKKLKTVTTPRTRVIVDYFNYLWAPVLILGEHLKLKMPQGLQNWIPMSDIANLLYLADFDVIKTDYRFLMPKYIPVLSEFMNRFMAKLPFIRKLCLIQFFIARKKRPPESCRPENYTTTVVIPCRNEKGNIEGAIRRTPQLGRHTELIFVDGNSTDGTPEEIERMIRKYPQKAITLIHQGDGIGKGDAVRKGYAVAKGDILMILDADLTVPPEDLPKFFDAIVEDKGEFINGSRLVYPMDDEAMRTLNLLGNKFFSLMFSWLLDQRFRDTLCGTKVIFRWDYERLAQGRDFFGNFDPFGDFDLIFGASKLNLKIVEIPIRYCERTYGSTNISRFSHGLLLFKMCWVAFKKLKIPF